MEKKAWPVTIYACMRIGAMAIKPGLGGSHWLSLSIYECCPHMWSRNKI